MTFLRGDTAAADTFADLAAPPNALARLDRSFAGLPSVAGTLPTLGGLPSASGMRVSQATSLQVSTVYSCVRIRSRDLARCRPQIQRVDATGNRAVVAGHPLAPLFTRPNRLQTWFEFAEQMHVAFLLRSNAYAVILRDWRGQPTELIPINPDLVTPLEAPDGSIFYNISRAGLWLAAVLEPVDIAVPDYDVLHVRDLTFNSVVGVSRIALARDAIGLALVQEQQASRWAGNGARPAGVLQSKKQLSEPAAQRLKASWDALQSGIANVGRTAVLEDGIEWHPMSLSSVDLEFMQARLTQVKEIARFWEVPLHKLGENEGLPRASIGELNADYVQNVVMSDATRYEQRIAMTFGIGDDLEVKFDEHELLRADLATMMNSARTGVLSGLLTQNEGRNYIGYGPLPNADTLLAPVNLAPNGSATDGVAPDGAGRPPAGDLPGGAKMVEAIAKAVAALMKSNPNHDAQGRFASGEGDGAASDDKPAAAAAAEAEDHAAVSHEIRLVVKGLAITAAAAIAMALLPEAVVGATAAAVVAGVAALAERVAAGMFTEAGISAAKHIAKELGFDTKEAEKIGKIVGDLLKAAEPTDPQAAKRAAILRHRLAAVLAFARDTLVHEVETQAPEATPAANLDAVLAAIGTAAAAQTDRLAALEAA